MLQELLTPPLRVAVGEDIILNSSSDWDFGSGRGLVVGGNGGSMILTDEGGRGAGVTDGGFEGGGWEEVESRCSRNCCCSNIFSSAVLHLMRVGSGTLREIHVYMYTRYCTHTSSTTTPHTHLFLSSCNRL